MNGTLTDGTGQNKAACAALTADITINKGVLDGDGGLNGDGADLTQWTPITGYTGTFDGQNHTVSGLYVSIQSSSGDVYAGLFGSVGSGGTVRNLTIADSYVSGTAGGNYAYAGGVCGENGGEITNCSNGGAVSTSGSYKAYAGGVCGWNYGEITNCSNSGDVTGDYCAGGVSGYNSGGIIARCSNGGAVSASASASGSTVYAGGVCGGSYAGKIENCSNGGAVSASGSSAFAGGVCGYSSAAITNCSNGGDVSASGSYSYAGGVCGYNMFTITNCYWLDTAYSGTGIGSGEATSKTVDQFASGEVAWLLNRGQTDGPWRQTLGEDGDAFPVLDAEHEMVYQVTFTVADEDSETGYFNSPVTLPAGSGNPGYHLIWSDGKGDAYNAGEVLITADAAFTGQWTANTYTVTFNSNGGTGAMEPQTFTYDTPQDLAANSFARSGYTFAGWNTAADGTGDSYSDGQNVSNLTAENDGEVTLYAQWKANPSSGGGTTTKTPSQQAVDEIEAARDGDTVRVTLKSGQTTLGAEVFEALAGRDVTLEVTVPGGVMWAVSGLDVPAGADLADIDMGVTLGGDTIPASVINTVTGEAGTTQLSLAHDGEFGFAMTLTAPLGEGCAGYWANLYHYDEGAGRLVFQSALTVGDDGRASFELSHASEWAVVVDSASHELPFADVDPSDWFANAVGAAYRSGLMTGYAGSGLFGPGDSLTREQAAAVLWRALGQGAQAPSCGMADVDQAAWYAPAVGWAASSGLMGGYADGSGLFGVADALTREQLAAVLWRAAGSPDAGAFDPSAFSDGGEASSWSSPALAWAVQTGVLSGSDDGAGGTGLRPTDAVTRAEMAAMLTRWLAAE